MKKLSIILLMGVMVASSSCKKYLDINKNPNQPTEATPELVLPSALVTTANNMNGFNSMGAQLVGYSANAGGYGGFGSSITYNFGAGDFAARWSTTYDNLEDYQYIIDQTAGLPEYTAFNAIGRIMKSHGFQLLVDTYNEVPYFEALKGADKLTPKYDQGNVIYKDLADQLDTAIAMLDTATNVVGLKPLGTADVMFAGDLDMWMQFANTLKLRIVLRGGSKVDFSEGNKTFSDAGFLTSDALINPGYVRDNGKQNPKWNTWGFGPTGSDGNKAWMPNTFVFSFYNGGKINDPWRGGAMYYGFPAATGINRLGIESNDLLSSPSGSFWYPSGNRDGASAGDTTGALKGPEAGYPVITAAESYFLQAEAAVTGLVAGDAKQLFHDGVVAAFHYTYLLPDDESTAGDYEADAAAYFAANATNRLVNFDLATTNDRKLEAIITQKYIALNYVNSEEAWSEYRRTHYPAITNGSNNGTQTFASSVSESTRADKLPARILYPSSEGSYNSANVPKDISPFTSTIFWAL
jgi:hypothetical protein